MRADCVPACACGIKLGMKTLFGLLLIAALAGASTGCSLTGDPEDKAFYNSGWLLPEAGANDRLMRDSNSTRPFPR
jgi:hypothetical protein